MGLTAMDPAWLWPHWLLLLLYYPRKASYSPLNFGSLSSLVAAQLQCLWTLTAAPHSLQKAWTPRKYTATTAGGRGGITLRCPIGVQAKTCPPGASWMYECHIRHLAGLQGSCFSPMTFQKEATSLNALPKLRSA